ncbi:Ankyrin repeat-containing protein NPR4 [Camellia lanceoleosa]|uniref:Ankyrin repeat-containing protein NPR4 n=1 Tax=Camellia lanceoleosa TaxID=1840588 RepID=A0ACC0GJR7_9ERIC|nr:Ankyrin repeat-containing protein NPR4 [Camellia lanceoleosa]
MWQGTLSIQSCFPEGNSTPNSARSQPNSARSQPSSARSQPSTMVTIEMPPKNLASTVVPPQPSSRSVVSLQLSDRTNTVIAAFSDMVSSEVTSGPASASLLTSPRGLLRVRTKATINLRMYVPLYQAALSGDWEKAKEFIRLHPSALSARITKGQETVLHIAAGARQTKFVEELVKLMDMKDLELQNKHDNTALCFAAASGNKRIAEVMVKKNINLPAVRGSKGLTALHMAALLGHRDMVLFLCSVTRDEDLTKEDFIGLLVATISSDLYDVALHILDCRPELAIEQDSNGETALHVLARKRAAFSGKSGLRVWHRFIHPWVHVGQLKEFSCCCTQTHSFFCTMSKYQSSKTIHSLNRFFSRLLQHTEEVFGFKVVYDKKLLDMQSLELVKRLWGQILLLDDAQIGNILKSPSRPLFVAAELGNFEFVFELLHSYPDLIWKVDEQSRSIFHIAVIHRQEKIFTLIYDIGAHKDLITAYKDSNNTNMLHLAGKLAPFNRLNIVSGAALQMQRELLWFKEVEKNVQPSYKEMRDMEGRTPRMLFTEEHMGLVKAGERWMKGTASSSMLVAALITTVMFAAIFTVPGGNNNIGIPNFLQAKTFMLFAVSDAFALFSSVTAILMFLSILTSRYAEEDFLETLPKRLIIGLTTLFFSIASMLVAFSATFFIVLGHQLAWVVIPVALIACIPVTLFAFLQFPLLADMVSSTYGSGIFARRNRDTLY